MLSAENVATPDTAETVVGPASVPPAGLLAMLIVIGHIHECVIVEEVEVWEEYVDLDLWEENDVQEYLDDDRVE